MNKVFIGTGKVSHVLDEAAPRPPDTIPERAPALCNIRPLWPGYWQGLNGDAHIAEELPLCRTCEMLMGAANVGSA